MVTDKDNDGVDDSLMSNRRKQLLEATLLASEIQKLAPDAIVELFELDMSSWNGGSTEYNLFFHAGTNELSQPVIWRGKKYEALPIEAEGFEATTQGTLPRPKLRLANINGLFSAGVREMDDFVGCRVIRRRTFKKFLDPNNFCIDEIDPETGRFEKRLYTEDRSKDVDKMVYLDPTAKDFKIPTGDMSPYRWNPTYDPYQHYPDEIWFVEQKVSETKWLIEWELSSPLDLQGVQLPRRQIIQNTCCWRYCSPECGWNQKTAKVWYDKDNKPTARIEDDVCAKRLSSCELRWAGADRNIPFGGFPGAVRYNT